MIKLDKVIGLLESVLDVRANRHKVLAENVANMDTPGYRAKSLDFQKILRARIGEGVTLNATQPGHIKLEDLDDSIVYSTKGGGREQGLDGNTVNIEEEMVKIAENNLMYNTAAQVISAEFRGIKSAIKGG